jgi:ABC-type glycerol-3-phosphate transport system substrate-binding protein
MVQNGGNVLSDDWSSSRLTDSASVEAVQLLHDFIWKQKISPKLDGNVTDVDLFVQNKLAFMGAGLWDVNSLKLAKFDPANYDVVPFPKIGSNAQKYLVGIGAAPIFTASRHKDAAWEFAKFLSSPGFQDTFIVNDGWSIPATRSGFNKMMQRPDFPKNGKIFYDSLNNSVLVPSPKQYGAIEASLLREFGAAMANSKSVSSAMASADKDVSAALKS